MYTLFLSENKNVTDNTSLNKDINFGLEVGLLMLLSEAIYYFEFKFITKCYCLST